MQPADARDAGHRAGLAVGCCPPLVVGGWEDRSEL